jgi:ABC-type amino acid transport substrate-binding protein
MRGWRHRNFLRFALIGFSFLFSHRLRAELPPDLQRIHSRGELVVGILSENSPPFSYLKPDGTPGGLDVEILTHAAQSLGVKLRWVRTTSHYKDLLELVAQQKVDIAASAIYPTLPRAERFLFSDPYLEVASEVAINRVNRARRGHPDDWQELLNQKDVSIGIFDDAGTREAAREFFPLATVTTYRDRQTLLPQLLNGHLAGALIDDLEMRKWRKLMPSLNLYVAMVKEARYSRQATFAISWKSPALQQWMNLFLRLRRADGSLEKWADRYLGEAE